MFILNQTPTAQADPNEIGPVRRTRSGACSVCKRPLSDPASVQRGMGPICAGKFALREGSQEDERPYDKFYDVPLQDGLYCARMDGMVYTNIPHLIPPHHSPDGFEFGYAGSGPADLAMNAVEAYLRHLRWNGDQVEFTNYQGIKVKVFAITLRRYQDFKFKFIGAITRDGGNIDFQNIYDWLSRWMIAESMQKRDEYWEGKIGD